MPLRQGARNEDRTGHALVLQHLAAEGPGAIGEHLVGAGFDHSTAA
jgi:hypothetical protein